jgi:hypothetical protein
VSGAHSLGLHGHAERLDLAATVDRETKVCRRPAVAAGVE